MPELKSGIQNLIRKNSHLWKSDFKFKESNQNGFGYERPARNLKIQRTKALELKQSMHGGYFKYFVCVYKRNLETLGDI